MANKKMCERHMASLADAVKHKGMWPLVRPARAAFAADVWLQGVAKKEDIDPLVIAWMEIVKKAHDMGIRPPSGRCVLCQVNVALENSKADASWIDNVTDLMVRLCETNGVMPKSRGHAVKKIIGADFGADPSRSIILPPGFAL